VAGVKGGLQLRRTECRQ